MASPAASPCMPFVFQPASARWERQADPPPGRVAGPLRLYTWNIDFASSAVAARLHATLAHLAAVLPSPPRHCVVLLQELHFSVLSALLETAWVRANFAVTDMAHEVLGAYFTISLVARDVPVVSVRRLFFNDDLSLLGRDCLFVDVLVGQQQQQQQQQQKQKQPGVLRIGNTHLESLSAGQRKRPRQLAAIAAALREPGVLAGVVAGDMNSISDEDAEFPAWPEIALNDVWDLETKNGKAETAEKEKDERKENDETGAAEGHTWGYQPRCRFAPKRMDKIFYTGDVKFEPLGEDGRLLQRLGVGLTVGKEDFERYESKPWFEGEQCWVSDHVGLGVGLKIGGDET